MYSGHSRLSVPCRISTLLHGPGCNLGNGRGCPLVVHYLADLQSVHRCRYNDNIVLNVKCQGVLVLALCLPVLLSLEYQQCYSMLSPLSTATQANSASYS